MKSNKIIVQVFNTFFSKFPQIITNLTEDSELASIERLERLNLIIILLIVLLPLSRMNQIQTLWLSLLMNVLIHFPNFIFPSEVLSCAINYLLKVAFSKLGFSWAMQWFLFLKQEKITN